jgi:hypothetical protein
VLLLLLLLLLLHMLLLLLLLLSLSQQRSLVRRTVQAITHACTIHPVDLPSSR